MKKLTTLILIIISSLIGKSASSTPPMSSYPSAAATILLDFDGEYVTSSVWNSGDPLDCAPSGMTDVQILEIFNRVSEDFRPFNINITTDPDKFLAAPISQRMRVVVTSTSFAGNVGGIAYVGSFTWGDDTPAFVFSNLLNYSPKMVAEACSHESGHTLCLSHQSRYDATCQLSETYHSGNGYGIPSWAPIMGNSYYRNMSSWSNGPTPYGCSSTQDNLSMITSLNGFTYRADDYTEVLDATTHSINPYSINTEGVITTTTDKDAFKFNLAQPGSIHINVVPFSLNSDDAGADLDVKVTLYNSATQIISVYNPSDIMRVTIDTALAAGTYYIMVEGTGNSNIDNYGSLGSYTITGFSGTLPIHDVNLTGKSDKGKHKLNWSIITTDPVKSIEIETSSNGSSFKPLTSTAGSATGFNYVPFEKNDIYYRLKATSVLGQIVYSNTIVLKNTGTGSQFSVSTLVHDQVTIAATDNYQYQLNDINGRMIAKGNGSKGITNLDISNQPGGIYIIQLFSNNNKQTERIIRQ